MSHRSPSFRYSVRLRRTPECHETQQGYAHLFAGELIDDAPTSNDEGDSDYVYTQVVLSF